MSSQNRGSEKEKLKALLLQALFYIGEESLKNIRSML